MMIIISCGLLLPTDRFLLYINFGWCFGVWSQLVFSFRTVPQKEFVFSILREPRKNRVQSGIKVWGPERIGKLNHYADLEPRKPPHNNFLLTAGGNKSNILAVVLAIAVAGFWSSGCSQLLQSRCPQHTIKKYIFFSLQSCEVFLFPPFYSKKISRRFWVCTRAQLRQSNSNFWLFDLFLILQMSCAVTNTNSMSPQIKK